MTQAVISLYVCEKSVVLERLDGRECVEQFADDHWTQLLKALCCLADKHQNVSGRQLILVTEKLYQLYMHTHSSVIFVNENENGEKRKNNKFVNEN